MKTSKTPNFYHDKPLFGMDIGHGSLKVMQLSGPPANKEAKYNPKVIGYGFTTFDKSAQENGVVVQPEIIAKAANELFKDKLTGKITTRRVSIAMPAYRTFTRLMHLPKLQAEELREAVELEAEQYISMPLEELYLDYQIVKESAEGVELFLVAVPRVIVDSYISLSQILGLEAILIEPTLSASGRLFSLSSTDDSPAVIIDFGSLSCDISIYDKHTLVTGTIEGGGVNFTEAIKSKLKVTTEEAGLIKTRYGLGASKRRHEIQAALDPTLEQIVKEIKRMLRYYEERYEDKHQISQIITLGGGANMPGLSDYLTQALRMAVRHIEPWYYLNYKGMKAPSDADKPMYATVTGLSLAEPKEAFN